MASERRLHGAGPRAPDCPTSAAPPPRPLVPATASPHPLEGFWKEILQAAGPDFSGSVVLHCSQGSIVKYELHHFRKPRGGAVALDRSKEARESP